MVVKTRKISKSTKGQSLIELIVAFGLMAVLLPALLTGLVAAREGKARQSQHLQASFILRETLEEVRSVREKGWSQFAVDGTYHPEISGSSWSLVEGADNIAGFTREAAISSVLRDASGNIVPSGGVVDPSTKKVVTRISWTSPSPSSIETTSYLQRIMSNNTLTHTTQADFDTGAKVTLETINTSGGELRLESWSNPNLLNQINIGGSENANALVVSGNYVYIGTDERGSARPEFYIYDLTTNSFPGSLETNENIVALAVSGNYVYLLTANNNARLRVVDVSNIAAPSIVATYDTGITINELSLAVSGNYAYLGTAVNSSEELWIIDMTIPTSPTLAGFREIGFKVNSLAVSDSTAYLATNDPAGQLKTVDITNKSSPGAPISYDVGNNRDGLAIFYQDNTVFLGIEGGGESDFFIINVTNPANPTALGSVNIGGSVYGISVLNGVAYLATDDEDKEFSAVGINDLTNPTVFGTANLGARANSVYFSGTNVFLSSNKDNAEFQIITGAGGSDFNNLGTYESVTLDAGSNVAFNNFVIDATVPGSATLRFQVAINFDNLTWNYFGPDGTSATYFTVSSAIPLSLISGRYARYKAYYTGNGSLTPTLNNVSFNYSP